MCGPVLTSCARLRRHVHLSECGDGQCGHEVTRQMEQEEFNVQCSIDVLVRIFMLTWNWYL